jgi:hypothetical protein
VTRFWFVWVKVERGGLIAANAPRLDVTWDVEGSRGSHLGSAFLSEVVKHRRQLPGIGHGVTSATFVSCDIQSFLDISLSLIIAIG